MLFDKTRRLLTAALASLLYDLREPAVNARHGAYRRLPVPEHIENRGRVGSPVRALSLYDNAGVNVSRVEAFVNQSGTLA